MAKQRGDRKKVRVFYHVCAVGPYWEAIVRDQLAKIQYSGLYHACDAVRCWVTGPEAERAARVLQEHGRRVIVEVVSPRDRTAERLTLLGMREHVEPGDRVLYVHSKGVTRAGPSGAPDPNVRDWRALMEWHLIARWRECLDAMDEDGFSTVGVNMHEDPEPHYSGNMWWCTGEHLLELPASIGPEYHDPEFYLLQGGLDDDENECVHESPVDHYHEPYPPSCYVDDLEVEDE